MEKLKVKPVIENEFWIITQDNIKVGQIKSVGSKIVVQVNGNTVNTNSMTEIKESDMFEFVDMSEPDKESTNSVHGYPTDCIAYNGVWNVKDNLPLYTQSPESKSWYAAGYYKLNINGNHVVQYCPKLITLERNEYTGPFKNNPGTNMFKELFE